MLVKHAYRRATSASLASSSQTLDSVWVSDAQLHAAWHSFTRTVRPNCRTNHHHTRTSSVGSNIGSNTLLQQHGTGKREAEGSKPHTPNAQVRQKSSVPGPLEAKRRAARRRMTALSTAPDTSLASGPYVPALFDQYGYIDVNNSREPKLSWKPPGIPPQTQTPNQHPWPPWLFPTIPPESTTFPAASPSLEILNATENEIKNSVSEVDEQEWKEALKKCKSLKDIHILASELDLSLQDPTVCRIAYQRLIKLKGAAPLDDHLEFLSERPTDPPEPSVVCHFLRNRFTLYLALANSRFPHHMVPDPRLKQVQSWLRNEISTGAMSELEIRATLEGCSVPFEPTCAAQEVLWTILEAFKSSKVRKIDDLEENTIHSLLAAAGRHHLADSSIRIASDVLTQLEKGACHKKTPKLTGYLTSFLETFLQSVKNDAGIKSRHGIHTGNQKYLVELIATLPSAVVPEVTVGLFQHLLTSSAYSDNLKHDCLEELFRTTSCQTLIQILRTDRETAASWKILEKQIASLHPRVLASYLGTLGQKDAAVCVVDNYILPQIGIKDSVDADKMHAILQTTLDRTQPDVTSSYTQLLDKVQEVSPVAFPHVARFLFEVTYRLPDSQPVMHLTKHLAKTGTISEYEVIDAIENVSQFNLPNAIKMFYSDKRIQIEACPAFASAIIASPQYSTKIIFALLNRSLHKLKIKEHQKPGPPQWGIRNQNHKSLPPDTLAFFCLVANKIALSPMHDFHSTHRMLFRILRMVPNLKQADRDFRTPRAELYKQLLPDDTPFTFAHAFEQGLIRKRLDAGRLVPGWVYAWVLRHINRVDGLESAHSAHMRTWQSESLLKRKLQNLARKQRRKNREAARRIEGARARAWNDLVEKEPWVRFG